MKDGELTKERRGQRRQAEAATSLLSKRMVLWNGKAQYGWSMEYKK